MIPYLDAGFLLTLLVRTDGSQVARQVLNDLPSPFRLTALHQLQVSNLIQQLKTSGEEDRKYKGRFAEQMWDWYFDEEVFAAETIKWEEAFADAVSWTLRSPAPVASPLLLLHVAVAKQVEATHYLSFDPRSRQTAGRVGLKVLPEKL